MNAIERLEREITRAKQVLWIDRLTCPMSVSDAEAWLELSRAAEGVFIESSINDPDASSVSGDEIRYSIEGDDLVNAMRRLQEDSDG